MSLITFYSALGLLSFALALRLLSVDCTSRKWLVAFMGFQAAYFALIVLDAQDFYISPRLYFLFLPLVFLAGPIILGYVGHISTRRYISVKDFLFCLIPIIMLVSNPDMVSTRGFFEIATSADYHKESYTTLFNFISIMAGIQVTTYIAMATWLLLKIREDWESYQSKILPRSWYQMVQAVAVIGVATLLQVISALQNPSGHSVSIGDIGFILQSVYFISIAINTALKRTNSDIIVQAPGVNDSIEIIQNPTTTETETASLTDENAEYAGPDITTSLIEHRWYLQDDLSLMALADHLGMTTHKLSEAINKGTGQNFYDFINGFRVKYAAESLLNDTTLTITDALYNAGFTSKSTFYTAFKKTYGCTPTQYRKLHKADQKS